MTKKDSNALASIICKWSISVTALAELMDYMAKDNPRFDKAKFIKACSVALE